MQCKFSTLWSKAAGGIGIQHLLDVFEHRSQPPPGPSGPSGPGLRVSVLDPHISPASEPPTGSLTWSDMIKGCKDVKVCLQFVHVLPISSLNYLNWNTTELEPFQSFTMFYRPGPSSFACYCVILCVGSNIPTLSVPVEFVSTTWPDSEIPWGIDFKPALVLEDALENHSCMRNVNISQILGPTTAS